ncbi:MAG: GWxTD domain-containing protein [Cytophagales bacterium]|nr:MAG: GWxTD domain-containing protein [Cytophagales bacterium]
MGINCNAKVVNKGALLDIFLELDVERLYAAATLQGIKLSYQIKPTFESSQVISADSIALNANRLQKSGNSFYLNFGLLKPQTMPAIMVLKIEDTQTKQLIFKEISLSKAEAAMPFVLSKTQGQVYDNFVSKQDTLRFEGADVPAYVYRIKQNFFPALPPMQLNNLSVNQNVGVDSFFSLPANTNFVLKTKGLYFAQSDTSSSKGIGFSVMENMYPKFTKVENLIEALIYISTPEEQNQISGSANKKNALDAYWLKLAGNEENARRIIRLYYQRVEYANRVYTTYKEGWKTDMGMVYIAFGAPQISTQGNQQLWTYYLNAGNIKVTFAFVQKKNQFSEKHYELIRKTDYAAIWYEAIEKWRMGLVAN